MVTMIQIGTSWAISCVATSCNPTFLLLQFFQILRQYLAATEQIQIGNRQQIQPATIRGNTSEAEFGKKSKICANLMRQRQVGMISKRESDRRNLIAVSTLWIGLLLASPHQIALRQRLKLKLYGDQKGATKTGAMNLINVN